MPFRVAALLLLLGGCGHMVPGVVTGDGRDFDFARKRGTDDCAPRDETKVEVRYLGSGGVSVRWRGDVVLLGPSFSNPPVWRAAVWRAKIDKARIRREIEALEPSAIHAILIGHSHYDHIADLPEIATHAPRARIYVNAYGENMLKAVRELKGRVSRVPAEAFQAAPSMRVRAVRSGHAPQLCPGRFWPCVYGGGTIEEPWKEGSWNRRRLATFAGGEGSAFIIELLGGSGRPRYTIYYNDAASDSPQGQVQEEIDLAVLTMAQWNWARDYPRDLLAVMRPRHVLVSHWDDFFHPYEGASRFVPNLSNASAARFLQIVNAHVPAGGAPASEVCGARNVGWTMPVVGTTLLFEPR